MYYRNTFLEDIEVPAPAHMFAKKIAYVAKAQCTLGQNSLKNGKFLTIKNQPNIVFMVNKKISNMGNSQSGTDWLFFAECKKSSGYYE